MAPHIDALWHRDSNDLKDPHLLEGRRFLHVKSANLYVVIGHSLNVTGDRAEWMVHYQRESEPHRGEFYFSRSMAEFLDGRFLEV